MSTENGLPRSKDMTRRIEVLRKRRDWIADRIVERKAEGLAVDLWLLEVDALDWAIECMEVERDATMRLRRRLGFDPTPVESVTPPGYAGKTSPKESSDAPANA